MWKNKKEWRWYLGVVFAALVLLGMGVTHYQLLSSHQDRIDSDLQETRKLNTASMDLELLHAEQWRLENKLARFHKQAPFDSQMGGLLGRIGEYLNQQQVADRQVNTGSAQQLVSVECLPITLRFNSGFVQVYEFLKQLDNDARLIRIDKLVMNSDRANAQPISVAIDLSTFSQHRQ